jgi:acetyl esterase/lipase
MNRLWRLSLWMLITTMGPAMAAAQVRVVRDIDYVPSSEYADKKDRLDLYVPAGAKGAPVVVSIHGGLLRQGDRSEEEYVGQRFAAAGFVTAVISYRLSPVVTHPAHAEDAAAAVAWVKRHIADHGGDPARLFVIGHSAGAYLAALIALDDRYLAAHRLAPKDLRAVVPVSAFFYVEREGVAPDRPKDVWGTDAATWRQASPAAYVRGDAPPMLILYADGDEPWRRQQQADFVQDLRAAGARSVDMRMIGGRTHMSIWWNLKNPGDETATAIVQYLEQQVKSGSW